MSTVSPARCAAASVTGPMQATRTPAGIRKSGPMIPRKWVTVEGLVKLSVDVNLEMAREIAARGVDFIFTGDDYSSAQGPFMSPAAFRRLFWPELKRVVGGFKALGLPVIKHGNRSVSISCSSPSSSRSPIRAMCP